MSMAIEDVLAERARQVDKEGFGAEHDDKGLNGSLARAGSCYALQAASRAWLFDLPYPAQDLSYMSDPLPDEWPAEWDASWWKPKDPRRDLVRAAALIIAEIERMDRAKKTKE